MMRALVLAAGQGTRLRPLTDDRPKCLVELAGISLLERQAATLARCGVEELVVVVGYRGELIEARGFETRVNHQYATTNMVESLFAARDVIRRSGDLIIAYGDIVYQDDNLERLLSSDAEIALMIDSNWRELWELRLENPLDDAETLVVDPDGYVVELGKKASSYDRIQGQYTGLIKIRSDRLEAFEAFYDALDRNAVYDGRDFANMYMTSFLQLLIDAGWKAEAVTVCGGWLEIDSVGDLQVYEKMAQSDELSRFFNLGPTV